MSSPVPTPAVPPYTPPPSIGHEIGVMFGWGGFMVVLFLAYLALWKMNSKREARKESARAAELANSGLYDDISGGPKEKQSGGAVMGNSVRVEGPRVGKN